MRRQVNSIAFARWRRLFYADPFVDMHNRMKEALVLLGRLPRAVVRPPLVKLDATETSRIRAALIASGLLQKDAMRAGQLLAGHARRSVWPIEDIKQNRACEETAR